MALPIPINNAEIDQKYEECRRDIEKLRQKINEKRKVHHPGTLHELAKKNPSDIDINPPFSFSVRRILRGHFGKIYALHWGPSCKEMVSASQDGKLMLWNTLTTKKKLAIPLRSAWVMACAYSPEGKLVACGGLDNLCSIYQITNDSIGWEVKQAYRELQQHEGYLSCCKFVDENNVITSSGDSTCILWDIETKTPKQQFLDHTSDVMSVDTFPSKNIFVSGSTDATSKIWDLRDQSSHCVANFDGYHESDINSVKFFPDGNAFASGSEDSECRLFDLRAQKQLSTYQRESVMNPVTGVDFSKSGNFLFAGYDDEPSCLSWNTLTGKELTTLEHPARVSSLQTSPDGYALATASWDCLIRIWA